MSSASGPEIALTELVGQIYEAAFDPAHWQAVLQHFAALVGATSAAAFLHNFDAAIDGSRALAGSFAVTHGLPDSALADYAAHYGALNPWAAREDALLPGLAVSSSMLYPDRLLSSTEFYGDYLRHLDAFYSLGGVADRTDRTALKFAFMRPQSLGYYEPHELALWQTLVPHVKRAARLHLRVQQQAQHVRDTEDLLSALAGGWIVVDDTGRALHLNNTARGLLGPQHGLRLSAAGHLQLASPQAQAEVNAALRAALNPACALDAAPAVVHSHGPAGRLRLEVVAFPGRNPAAARRQCAVLLAATSGAPQSLCAALQRVYGMTASEAALTEALTQGQSLAEFAERRSVSIHTVRTQLKAATSKAGAKRQADLVRIVLTGPAAGDARPSPAG